MALCGEGGTGLFACVLPHTHKNVKTPHCRPCDEPAYVLARISVGFMLTKQNESRLSINPKYFCFAFVCAEAQNCGGIYGEDRMGGQ